MTSDICFGKERLLEKLLNELVTKPRKPLHKFNTCVTHIGKECVNQSPKLRSYLDHSSACSECCHLPHKELPSASLCLLKTLHILSINSCQTNPSCSHTGQIQKPTPHWITYREQRSSRETGKNTKCTMVLSAYVW